MIQQKMQEDQIQAMKSKDSKRLETLRYILAQIKNKEGDKQSELTDDEVMNVLRKVAKELHESITSFEKGKRPDLIEESKAQLAIVASYLPKELSDEELKKEVAKIVAKNKELYEKSPKSLIGICIKELKNKAGSYRIIQTLSSIQS